MAFAAQIAPAQQTPAAPIQTADAPVQDKRAFGVLPNYRTVEGSIPFHPLTAKQKFTIATKDTIDGPSYVLAGFFAGIAQINNTNPSFGQGLLGYAHRYGTGLADQDLGNFMTEAVMPTVLREDPRYFRRGTGSVKSRIWYAVTRTEVTRTDKNKLTFNFGEYLGNGAVGALGNLYYPDSRGLSPTMQRMFTQIATDSLSNCLKEFWPDVKRKMQQRKLAHQHS